MVGHKLGERRELNPRMMDSQSIALIHLATSALKNQIQAQNLVGTRDESILFILI